MSPGPGDLERAVDRLFGVQAPLARRYVDQLSGSGLERGLIGPREVPRIWERHVLNCAVVSELIEPGAAVVDVGSGAGLPGLVLAIARPDLTVTLLEPLLRRSIWLGEVVAELGLTNTEVHRGRAEEFPRGLAPVVTARAVAPLDRLWQWCGPLLRPGGRLLALKGSMAAEELEAARSDLVGAAGAALTSCGQGLLQTPTMVVVVTRGDSPSVDPRRASSPGRRRDVR
jgi:16S rRNA (guanine527-N7)-methyltransferase